MIHSDRVEKILTKKANGYAVRERTDEYSVVDGQLTLVKRKVVTKHVPPDVAALKALLQLSEVGREDVETMTDEQLKVEKLRLLNLLRLCDAASGETDIKKEESND